MDLTHELRLIDFEYLEMSECISAIEKVLEEQADKAEKDIHAFFGSGLQADVVLELPVLLDNSYKANSRFPDLFYRGLFVTIWSAFELGVTRLAIAYSKSVIADEQEREKAIKKLRILADVKAFFEKNHIVFPVEWGDLDEIREARNLIVHHNGDLQKVEGSVDERDKKVNSTKAKVKDFMMRRVKQGNESLTWANQAVDVTADFCRELCGLCKSFLRGLIEQIQIRRCNAGIAKAPATVAHPDPTVPSV